MRFYTKRFLDEFFLYSSQFVFFFILMLFLIPAVDALSTASLLIVVGFLIIQIALLVGQGYNPFLRVVFSFITPMGYSLVRILAGSFVALDMANVFLWLAAIYIGLFQALALAPRNRGIKRVAEGLLALGAVFVFVFFYFYLDLRIALGKSLAVEEIGLETYRKSLDVRSFVPAFARFLESPQHAFFAFGAATFGFMLLANKFLALSLRARIAALFGEPRLTEALGQPETANAQEVSVVVLSADIRDFTSFATKLSPARAVDVLNRYYGLWNTVAERNRGRVAGITGDSVLVVFGLVDGKDAAERAVASAFEFLGEMPGLRDDLTAASLPAIGDVSVGIHAGTLIAGDLGLPGERHLGVFGDAVSVAARLDSLCREFSQELLVSQPIFRQLGIDSQAKFLRMGEVLLRNSVQPVPVYGRK